MSQFDKNACNEYNELSRRQVLGAGAFGLMSLAIPDWLPKVVLANDFVSNRDVIVQIYLRGGCDGLSVCVPYGDSALYTHRPNIAIGPPGSGATQGSAIDLDGFFGLAPALTQLYEVYQNRGLAIVHSTGSTDPSRSHFDAQRYMEVGKPQDASISTGWLGRHLATSQPMRTNAPLRGLGMSFGLQQTLAGGPLSVPVPDPSNFNIEGDTTSRTARRTWLSQQYANEQALLREAAINTQATIDLLGTIGFSAYSTSGSVPYPNTSMGNSLRMTAALIRADVGVEAIAIDMGGWDTHINQGAGNGTMASNMSQLGNALRAFYEDLVGQGRFGSVTTVIMSEFGRTVRENSSAGTDHGHGNVMLLMGGNVNGGRVHTNGWPGLSAANLYQGQDLAITIDHRDVLAEVITNRLGNGQNLGAILPNYNPVSRGIVL
jgi:uncharacterized protein (DUF1501 family)